MIEVVVIGWLLASLVVSVIAGRALRGRSAAAASQLVTRTPHAQRNLARVVPIGSARRAARSPARETAG